MLTHKRTRKDKGLDTPKLDAIRRGRLMPGPLRCERFRLTAFIIIVMMFFAISNTAIAAAIGEISEQTAPATIQRKTTKVATSNKDAVESFDLVSTTTGRTKITFSDKSTATITEHSELLIDEFVYDPGAKELNKVVMNVALGTVRFTSGIVGKLAREKVDIKTPTATIGIRGTDFSLSVDELGRTLAVLLPSCPPGVPEGGAQCTVGSIEVSNETGTVLLEEAYQAIVVDGRAVGLSKIFKVEATIESINNDLLIAPPKGVVETRTVNREQRGSGGALDVDLLVFKGLKENLLDKPIFETNSLVENVLEVDFLENLLDASNRALAAEQGLLEKSQTQGVLPNFRPVSGLTAVVDDTNVRLRRESASALVSVALGRDTGGALNIEQSGSTTTTPVNSGDVVRVNIRQSN